MNRSTSPPPPEIPTNLIIIVIKKPHFFPNWSTGFVPDVFIFFNLLFNNQLDYVLPLRPCLVRPLPNQAVLDGAAGDEVGGPEWGALPKSDRKNVPANSR